MAKTATAAMTAAAQDPNATPTFTLFPPGDCAAGLPVNPIQHDVVFAELKKLERTIDDLPYSIVLPPRDVHKLPTNTRAIQNVAAGTALSSAALSSASVLDLIGGVPIENARRGSVTKLKAPAIAQVALPNLKQAVARRQITTSVAGGKVKLRLTDAHVADLLSGKPIAVQGSGGAQSRLVRVVPPRVPATRMRLAQSYDVGHVADFIRDPRVRSLDGSQVNLPLSAKHLLALSTKGETKIRVGGKQVALIASRSDAGGGLASSSQAATAVTSAGQGLESGGVTRSALDSGTPADSSTEDAPAPSATSLKLALYLPWHQYWRLKGYSRGELLHSLSLAPQEEVTIEISSWDRRKRTFEDSAQSEFEQTTEFTVTEKDTQSVAREIANQTDLGMNVGGEVGYNSAGFNVGGHSSTDVKVALKDSSKQSLELLSESVRKASSKLRLQRETKIGETTETGTEEKTTRKVRNANMCHTVTFNYHEVLAHYDIVTEFAKESARLCVLAPNPVNVEKFTYTNVRYYDSVLRRVLLVPAHADGLDAAKKLFAQDQLCEAKRRNEICSAVGGLPKADNAAQTAMTDQTKRAAKAFGDLLANETLGPPILYGIPEPSGWSFLIPYPIWTFRLIQPKSFQRWMYLHAARRLAPHLFDVLSALSAKQSSLTFDDVKDLVEGLSSVDSLKSIGTQAISSDENSLYGIIRAAYSVPPPVVLTDVPKDAYAVDDAGLIPALMGLEDLVLQAKADKEKAEAQAAMAANQATVKSDYSDKEIAEALEAVDALTQHLNQYRNYYLTSIFKLMPFPDSFLSMLTAFGPLIERRVLGFDRDKVALSVNADLDPRTKALFDELVTNNSQLQSLTTQDSVVLPTSAIHVEGRIGTCGTCEEYIVQLRKRDLQNKDAEIDLKRESVVQQKLESERYRRRLAAKSYGDPIHRTPVFRVEEIEKPKADEPKPTT